MNVLIACEESQAVCIEFRKRGHREFSCDIQECSGGHPEWHICGDVLPLLNGNCEFVTQNRQTDRQIGRWDLIIAFPPCTHLAVSGARHFEQKRKDGRQREGIEFFCKFFEADCNKIAIENPINIISGDYIKQWFPDIAEKYGLPKKPSQTIQPWQFGHAESKATRLWLKGLQPLQPTNIVKCGEKDKYGFTIGSAYQMARVNGKIIAWNDPQTAKLRSKTYQGVARAMAEQWG